MVQLSRETKNFFGLVLFGGTYGAALDYAHTHGGAIEYPVGTHHERGILTFAAVYSVAPQVISWYRMMTESFIEIDPLPAKDGSVELPTLMAALQSDQASRGIHEQLRAVTSQQSSNTTNEGAAKVFESDGAAASPSKGTGIGVDSPKSATSVASASDVQYASIYGLAVKGLKRRTIHFTAEENSRRRFIRKHPLTTWQVAFATSMSLYTGGYLLTAYGWNKLPSLSIAAALAAPALYFYYKWDRSIHGVVSMIFVGLAGASMEAFLNTYVQSMTYQTNDILGIPYWLFWIYALSCSTFGQSTRFLLEPGHRTKVFVGVDNLPHKWARAFYSKHVGLPKTEKVVHQ